ncbi:P-loop containing nucleoside triphosphate hydrolase protein [Myxozyma melibiosi]|uniref:P-loop containing nucleoside triphosphate hydrolase protein n=1 Tax=Myxozyma melibiosi TaxID=54550 RepID=A0ABR1F7G0_9ASCO
MVEDYELVEESWKYIRKPLDSDDVLLTRRTDRLGDTEDQDDASTLSTGTFSPEESPAALRYGSFIAKALYDMSLDEDTEVVSLFSHGLQLRSSLERAFLIAQIVLHTVQLGLSLFSTVLDLSKTASLLSIIFWSYALSLTLYRKSTRSPDLSYKACANLAFVYLTYWPISAIDFRSVLISDHSRLYAVAATFDFLLATAVSVIALSLPLGYIPSSIQVIKGFDYSPEPFTPLISVFSMAWVLPILLKSRHKELTYDDLYDLPDSSRSLTVSRMFHTFNRGKTTSFRRSLLSFRFTQFIIYSTIATISGAMSFGPTILLKFIVGYIEDPSRTPRNMAWFYVFLLLFNSLVTSCLDTVALWGLRKISIELRALLITEIYSKALQRHVSAAEPEKSSNPNEGDKDAGAEDDSTQPAESSTEQQENTDEPAPKPKFSTGMVMNLMSTDALKVCDTVSRFGMIIKILVLFFVAFGLLFQLLGKSAIAGVVAFAVSVPLNAKLANAFAGYEERLMEISDRRVTKTNEVLQNIKIIKYFAWENMFLSQIFKLRAEELLQLSRLKALTALGNFSWFGSPLLISGSLLASYTLISGHELTASVAFGTISLVNVLKMPLAQFSDTLPTIMSAKVSFNRIAEFMDDTHTTEKYAQLSKPRGENSPYIGFENASFTWGTEASSKKFKLLNLSVDFPVGKLSVIIGPTGSGKTSLLLSLLGEMKLLKGSVYLPGITTSGKPAIDSATGYTESVAYCAQQAWILNDTIRNNILFGRPMDEDRYRRVIYACALARDLEILEHGDLTEVGEKGISLSGGQKQRISLARAVYSSAKHLLLDDCLSAIDAHSALWVYNKCLTGPLMKGRTCILVSHNVSLVVPGADFVVSVGDGQIKFAGSPVQALQQNLFADDEALRRNITGENQSSFSSSNPLGTAAGEDADDDAESEELELYKIQVKHESQAPGNEESQETGAIKWRSYTSYLNYIGGLWFLVAIIAGYAVQQGLTVSKDSWVGRWSEAAQADEAVKDVSSHGTAYYFSIYVLISIVYVIFTYVLELFGLLGGIRGSRRIFTDLVESIIHATPRFFDTTPVGRLLNRFGKDIYVVDQELFGVLFGTMLNFAEIVTIFAVVMMILPQFGVVAMVIIVAMYQISVIYTKTSLQLRRMLSVSMSPIFQHFGETIGGLSTIRAYGHEARFAFQNMSTLDRSLRPFTLVWASNRWMTFTCQSIGNVVSILTGFFLIWRSDFIDPGFAGLCFTYAITFSENMSMFVLMWTMKDMNMNSIERLVEYTDVAQEAPAHIESSRPPIGWPHEGSVEVTNLSLRYAPNLPRVIENMTFEVKPGWNVGIVGRTGAGKSTIATAFFRFLEADEGKIVIDGIDISTIGLHDLREALAIIPQDPTLFSGTVRSNLDPFDQYSDSALFEALRRVHLIDSSSDRTASSSATTEETQFNIFTDLDSPISESGSNLSQGQRQLMCLARSLLKSPQIIFLDEATASIDYATDALLQKTIREEFRKSTIMTIAHRLRSIIDYDRILVLDAGKIVEFATPFELIAKEGGVFRGMCESSGEFDVLREMAEQSFSQKK